MISVINIPDLTVATARHHPALTKSCQSVDNIGLTWDGTYGARFVIIFLVVVRLLVIVLVSLHVVSPLSPHHSKTDRTGGALGLSGLTSSETETVREYTSILSRYLQPHLYNTLNTNKY